MVWRLTPVDSFPDAKEFYFFDSGTYTIGRKGCDVIIQTDKGVSRIHAKLIIERLPKNAHVLRINDVSKYGTFVNKQQGSRDAKPVNELPNQEKALEIGDLITFGLAVFRFSAVPLVFFIHKSKLKKNDSSFQEIAAKMGASFANNWNNCTHVLADETSVITLDLIDAIIAGKPVIHYNWVKVLAEKSVRTEFPSENMHLLSLMYEGEPIKVVEPQGRLNCLSGQTFLLGSRSLYKYGSRLESLLKAYDGDIIHVDDFCSSGRVLSGDKKRVILVIPASGKEIHKSPDLSSFCRIDESKLVGAVLLGKLDSSAIITPCIQVSSSNSTDETIVADSDVEADTATTNIINVSSASQTFVQIHDREEAIEIPTSNAPEKKLISDWMENSRSIVGKIEKADGTEPLCNQNSDIIFSQSLIVQRLPSSSVLKPASLDEVINFKRFKKRETSSGNSFGNLVPFSKDPYRESECEPDMAEFRRQEKKRKQMEAIADDLFHAEKVKKRGRGAGGSIRNLL